MPFNRGRVYRCYHANGDKGEKCRLLRGQWLLLTESALSSDRSGVMQL